MFVKSFEVVNCFLQTNWRSFTLNLSLVQTKRLIYIYIYIYGKRNAAIRKKNYVFLPLPEMKKWYRRIKMCGGTCLAIGKNLRKRSVI